MSEYSWVSWLKSYAKTFYCIMMLCKFCSWIIKSLLVFRYCSDDNDFRSSTNMSTSCLLIFLWQQYRYKTKSTIFQNGQLNNCLNCIKSPKLKFIGDVPKLRLTFTYFKFLNQSVMLLAVFLLIILCSRCCFVFKKAWKFRSGSGLDKGQDVRLGCLWLSCDTFVRSNEFKPSLLLARLIDATVAYPNNPDDTVP